MTGTGQKQTDQEIEDVLEKKTFLDLNTMYNFKLTRIRVEDIA